jgi:aminopeptidase N
VDHQARIPSTTFNINGGEKFILFQYAPYDYTNDIWLATYSEEDFEKGRASYSDECDIVAPLHYDMEIDLREARKELRTKMRIDFESAVDNLRVLPMMINEGLTEYDDIRKDESMRVLSARYNGQDLPYVQEEWETGITFLLPDPIKKGEKFSIEVSMAGDFIDNQRQFEHHFYPQSNTCWYPRHGYLKRSTFDMVFRHNKRHTVASIGTLVREEQWPDEKDERLTEFRIEDPVSFTTFAAGDLERHTQKRDLSFGKMELEVYSLPGSYANRQTNLMVPDRYQQFSQRSASLNEEFVLAELGNALNFFSKFFGPYPYQDFKAAFHPFSFGQGMPTILLIPAADEANRDVFKFIAHETAHQWWGNMVAWRSYRDQWLSEGFAEYSGMLYTWERDSLNSLREQIKEARALLDDPPKTSTGVGQGKVAELGPLILGRRLSSRHSRNAYQNLTYDKGALVLRMLHFLFTDASTGNGDPFFNMMADFVKRYKDRAASTEEFQQVANEHFPNTYVAKQFGLKDLNWFFRQWVYEAKFPSYKMEYKLQSGEGGKAVLSGTIFQENAGQNWFMPLPVTLKFSGDQKANIVLYANGPQTPFEIPLPMKPGSVELDPDMWILAEHTDTKKK